MQDGFQPPTAVWLIEQPHFHPWWKKYRVATIGSVMLIFIVAAAISFGAQRIPSKINAIGWETAEPGDCVSLQFTNSFVPITKSSAIVPCKKKMETYTVITGIDASKPCQTSTNSIRLILTKTNGKSLCLQRELQIGQCTPISADLDNPKVSMPMGIIVPCNAPPTSEYPNMARLEKIGIPEGEVCPKTAPGRWQVGYAGQFLCFGKVA